MQAVDSPQNSAHPLSFLSPLLRSADFNIISVLLQSLAALPVQTWAGGAVMVDVNGNSAQKTEITEEPIQLAASPLADIAEAELFGEEVGQDVWKKVEEDISTPKVEATFPPLFTESEVGVIVGFLRSRDEAIRMLVSANLIPHKKKILQVRTYRLSRYWLAPTRLQMASSINIWANCCRLHRRWLLLIQKRARM